MTEMMFNTYLNIIGHQDLTVPKTKPNLASLNCLMYLIYNGRDYSLNLLFKLCLQYRSIYTNFIPFHLDN